MAISGYFAKIIAKLKTLGIAESVTWKKRTIGALDPETAEPTLSWGNDETIDVLIRSQGITEFMDDLKGEQEPLRMWTAAAIQRFDRIVRNSKVYEIGPVEDRTEAGHYATTIKELIV